MGLIKAEAVTRPFDDKEGGVINAKVELVFKDEEGRRVHYDPHEKWNIGMGGGSVYELRRASGMTQNIMFQSGSVPKNGVNGWTNELFLSIIKHRIGLLDKKFPSKENEAAIQHIELAIMALEERTRDRKKRGVEGKYEK